MITTKDLIVYIRDVLPQNLKSDSVEAADLRFEIVQSLIEYEDIKRLLFDAMNVLEELYSFLNSITREFE